MKVNCKFLCVLNLNIPKILEIERRNSVIKQMCLSTKMPGNRALHEPHKSYQCLRHGQRTFNVAKTK